MRWTLRIGSGAASAGSWEAQLRASLQGEWPRFVGLETHDDAEVGRGARAVTEALADGPESSAG